MLQQRESGLFSSLGNSPSSLQTVIRHPQPGGVVWLFRDKAVWVKSRSEAQGGSDTWWVGTQQIQDPWEVAVSRIPESGVLKLWPWDPGHTSKPTQLLPR